MNRAVRSSASRNPVERRKENQTNNDAILPGIQLAQGNIVSIPMNLLRKQQPLVLWCFPVLLLLSGCGDVGPDCGAPEVRNSVVKGVADDRNNRLVNFAVENSDSVAELLSHAKAEAEKSAIRDKAKQRAIYSLDDTIIVNSKSRAAASCTGLLYVTVEETTVQKEVEFKVEQAADGKTSVSVRPFQF
jgi:hypothetical protein